MPSKEYFTTVEAAKFLADLGTPYTVGTLAVWRSRKEGPEYVKVRNRPLYTERSLRSFAQGRRVLTVDSVSEGEVCFA